MNRRDFLSNFSKSATAVGAATAAAAIGVHTTSKARVADGASRVRNQVKALEKRVDEMDASHRRLVRIVAITISVSTGIDLATLL